MEKFSGEYRNEFLYILQDFESDGELRQLLEDFLQTITEKSPTDSQEYFGALHLLE